MKVAVFKIGLDYVAIQTKDPEPGVQNNITAHFVYLKKKGEKDYEAIQI